MSLSEHHRLAARDALNDSEHQDMEGESWLISYLDTLTLLLTMFVVLLAFADFSPEPQPAAAPEPIHETAILPPEPRETIETSAPGSTHPPEEALPALGSLLLQGLDDSVQVVVEKDRINLAISDRILFDTGEAALTTPGLAVLDPLVAILKAEPYHLTVAGHTDNLPIATERFPSNWELSAARAASVVRYLQRRGIPAARLRAIGYADTRPVHENEAPAGRAANRRVEIVIHLGNAEQTVNTNP
ncbi:MAG: OmpA family protein [Gammaproteobacteria bacterium]